MPKDGANQSLKTTITGITLSLPMLLMITDNQVILDPNQMVISSFLFNKFQIFFLVQEYLKRAASKEKLVDDYEVASAVQSNYSDYMSHVQRSRQLLARSQENLDHLGVEVICVRHGFKFNTYFR